MSNYNKPIRRINRFLMQTKSDKDVPETAEVELPPGLLAPVPSPATATDATATQSSSDRYTATGSNAPQKNIVSQADDYSANRSMRAKRACLAKEPFACVAKSIIDGLPAGAASKKSSISDEGCEHCPMEECQLIAGSLIDDGQLVLITKPNMRAVAKCTPKDDTCGNTDSATCLKPVSFVTAGHEHSELFPFNLCTRKMLVDGTCPKDLLSRSPYVADKIVITLDYHVQCEPGFMVPTIASDIGCVPSLHQAAGLSPDDPEVFPDDVKDLEKIQFCAKLTQLPNPLNCVPRPLKGFTLAAGLPKSVAPAAETPCLYPGRGAKKAEDCVLMDLLIPPTDTQKEPLIIPGDRNGIGPYATLQSTTDNLARKWTPWEEPHRMFPRCIDISDVVGLTQPHVDEVQNDFFLNCETNPYYQRAVTTRNAAQMAALKIEPTKCDTMRSSRRLFCRWLDFASTTAVPAEESPDLARQIFAYPLWIIYDAVLLAAVVFVFIFYSVHGCRQWRKIVVENRNWRRLGPYGVIRQYNNKCDFDPQLEATEFAKHPEKNRNLVRRH
ncbi:unnamed protein product, partial [Mesorhabditis spiculigera]